jgi:hypothetical protein
MPFSGKNGKVTVASTDIADTGKWSLDVESELQPYASNATGGRKKRIAGLGDSKGQVDFMPDGATACPVVEGTTYTFKLYEDASHFHTVIAKVAKIHKETDVETGKIVKYTANIEEDGGYTPPTYS